MSSKKIVFLNLLFSLLCMVSLCFQGCDSGDDSEEESASSEDPIEEVDDSTVKATAKKASKAVGAKKAIASNNVRELRKLSDCLKAFQIGD